MLVVSDELSEVVVDGVVVVEVVARSVGGVGELVIRVDVVTGVEVEDVVVVTTTGVPALPTEDVVVRVVAVVRTTSWIGIVKGPTPDGHFG